jgi:N-acyl-D-aspartate/D-glutamate deacylase
LDAEALFILELYRSCNPQMIYEDMQEEDMLTILRYSKTAIGSDSGVRSNSGGKPHPRGWGTFPRLFGRYVRTHKAITLREAVYRTSVLPAAIFGIPERVQIRVGYWADLVLFDPERLSDRATYEEPLRRPEGIEHVLVNGQWVVREGRLLPVYGGRPVRRLQAFSGVPTGMSGAQTRGGHDVLRKLR